MESSTSSEILIQIKNVSMEFNINKKNQAIAIKDINLDINKNEFITLLGPSGCGKTTLLRLISGLILPSSGEIIVDGRKITGPVDSSGMMFQSPTLLKWRSSFDNVFLPAEVRGCNTNEYKERAQELLTLVGLKGFGNHYPRELSGGMQQRVSLARALMLDPHLLLMDEPFGALDALTRDEMGNELVRIWQKNPKTVVFVTHSIREAIALSDRIIVMTPRPGKVSRIFKLLDPRPREARKMGTRYNDLLDEIHAELGSTLISKDHKPID